MKRTRNISRTILFSTVGLMGFAACSAGSSGPSDEEGVYLSVVGDRNVFLDHNATQRLSVRYHDSRDQPLAGEVSFRIVGDAGGSTISKNAGVTNSQGIVELEVKGGADDASFNIEATAQHASAEWTVAVGDGDSVPPLDPKGTYRLDSRFDVSQLPGDVGGVINDFIEITDDPLDPATWLLDEVFDEMDIPSFLRAGLDAFVYDLINQYAPSLVQKILDVGDKLGQAAKKFGTVSELAVARGSGDGSSESRMAAVHTMTGFVFRIDGSVYDFSIDELGGERPVVENISFEIASGDVSVGAHAMPVRYGGFLALALDEVIIPEVDPGASSLHELFQNQVNCVQIGYELYLETGWFSPGFWQGGCDIALQAAADGIMDEITDLDQKSPLVLQISGDARALDNDGDRKVDAFNNGRWSGSLDFDGSVGDFAEPGRFTGERMGGK